MKTRSFPAIAAAVIAALVAASALAQSARSSRSETTEGRRGGDDSERDERPRREASEDRSREEKSRDEKSRDEKSRDDRSREDKPRAASDDRARATGDEKARGSNAANAASDDEPHADDVVRDTDGADDAARADAPAPPADRDDGKTRSWLARGSNAPALGAPAEASGSSTGLTIGAVLLVLALAAGAIVLRFRKTRFTPISIGQSRLNVLSSSRVGPKAFAVTAHVNGRVLLLGVTDHSVTHLGWLDPPDSAATESKPDAAPEAEMAEEELPDDYPGSALRASRVPREFASSSNLKRFQEVLRGAEEARQELPMRPSYVPPPVDAAAMLAAQTSDVVSQAQTRSPGPVSLRRKRRTRDSIPPRPHKEQGPAASRAPRSADPSLEGQVAGLRALRNGG